MALFLRFMCFSAFFRLTFDVYKSRIYIVLFPIGV